MKLRLLKQLFQISSFEGLWWVSIVLAVFSLVSARTGFILAHFLAAAGQICRN